MKVVVLVENHSCDDSLYCEHGLSLYIETGNHKILFDFGQSAAFVENAEKLGVALEEVDFAVLSHGHYDHGGGIAAFLSVNSAAPVFVSEAAFEPHYNASDKYIGLDPALRQCDRILVAGENREIVPEIRLLSCKGRAFQVPIDSSGLTCERDGKRIAEEFDHEQYLLIEEEGKRILISGCSHKGILNIVDWFRPDVLIGGFHFMKLDPESKTLIEAAQVLRSYPTHYYTGHCTGDAQVQRLHDLMGQCLDEIHTGTVLYL